MRSGLNGRKIYWLILSAWIGSAVAQVNLEADTEIYRGEQVRAAEMAESTQPVRLKSADASAPQSLTIELSEVADEELQVLSESSKLTTIGIGRSLPFPYPEQLNTEMLDWVPADGGYAAVFTVRSPQAAALRLFINIIALPMGVELRFYNPAPSRGGRRSDCPAASITSRARVLAVIRQLVTLYGR